MTEELYHVARASVRLDLLLADLDAGRRLGPDVDEPTA